MRFSVPVAIVLGLLSTLLFQSSLMAQETQRIVFLGDSITQAGAKPGGYVSQVREMLTRQSDKTVVIGAGISGHKVPDLQIRLQRDVLDKKPTLVVIYIGINDVWHSQRGRGTPAEKFEAGLKDLIARIKSVKAEPVLCTASVIGEKTDGSNPLDKMLDEYCEISRRVASETGVRLLDLRKAFLGELKSRNQKNLPNGILTTDGVHLNAAGEKFVANQMMRIWNGDKSLEKPWTVMRHIVLFKFKDGLEQAAIDEVVSEFGKLKEKIGTIIEYEAGTNVSPENLDQGFTHAFVVTFKNAADRDAYLPHPAHKAFVKILDGRIDKVLVFDFEAEK